MIGLSLIAEGFGFHIPKGYLYAAIGFSILIELFNQIARRNFIKHESRLPRRQRTAEAIIRLMGGRQQQEQQSGDPQQAVPTEAFAEEERYMISGVLTLASRSLRSVMTPRTEISWVDCNRSQAEIREQLLDTHTVCSLFAATLWIKSLVWFALKTCWWRLSGVSLFVILPRQPRQSWCLIPWM